MDICECRNGGLRDKSLKQYKWHQINAIIDSQKLRTYGPPDRNLWYQIACQKFSKTNWILGIRGCMSDCLSLDHFQANSQKWLTVVIYVAVMDCHGWLSWIIFMDDFHVRLSWMTVMDIFHAWLSWMTFMDDFHRWLSWMTFMDDFYGWFSWMTWFLQIDDRLTDKRTDIARC